MNYRYEKVNQQLADYVQTVLVLDDNSDAGSSGLPLVTNAMPALLCKSSGDKNFLTLYGQSVPDEKWAIEMNETLIALFFKPFSIGAVFKLSAKELKGKPVELNIWHAQKAMALQTQLLYSKSTEEKIEILNHFILSQFRANERDCEIIRLATDKLMQDTSPDALSQLLNELHLSERTLQRIFKKYVGITANEYRRICQFYFAFSQLKGGDFDKLTDVAYTHGYFDQSHFIRAFKEFAETTPNDYVRFGLKKENSR